jgi:uncharacterized protein
VRPPPARRRHLSLVANARREQRQRLIDVDVTTVQELADAPADLDAGRRGREAFEILRHQAKLQVVSRTERRPTHRHLGRANARGYARLPAPSLGDVFFDLEGDPYTGSDGGIEYLWGWWTADGGYEGAWAHDRVAEKAALERLIEFVLERRRRHPGARVFHYAPHEASKLTSLSLAYATREDAVDDLLRSGALVDLYAGVRQALQAGEESYGLKPLERHHGFVRLERTVREGGGSIVAYERWLATGDDALLEAIRTNNEEDCRSTLALREWLVDTMRPEAAAELGVDFDALAARHARGGAQCASVARRAAGARRPADRRPRGRPRRRGRAPAALPPAPLPPPRGQAGVVALLFAQGDDPDRARRRARRRRAGHVGGGGDRGDVLRVEFLDAALGDPVHVRRAPDVVGVGGDVGDVL